MEKRSKTLWASKEIAPQQLSCMIQLWRAQRHILNNDIEDSLCTGLLGDEQNQDLEPLCERLMDYVCVGHFNIYEKLLHLNKPLEKGYDEMLKAIYHNIESTTDQALTFNDKYEKARSDNDEALTRDLQKLNKSLALRFVLEEQLLEISQA